HARVRISIATAAAASRCACGGRLIVLPARHHRRMKKTEMPITAANDRAVKAQRFQVMSAHRWAARRRALASLHLNTRLYPARGRGHRGAASPLAAYGADRNKSIDARRLK